MYSLRTFRSTPEHPQESTLSIIKSIEHRKGGQMEVYGKEVPQPEAVRRTPGEVLLYGAVHVYQSAPGQHARLWLKIFSF
ncbi:jg15981 [Pararge aegeria aegeria]|uniref:Jg15981 protein n=1 Tax=Pararge aegeria aegeria TaxID=348720 RepID=A0A8S4SPU1_9NEOP|nr:jg15981 [Pararge aegeria aegeria]